MTTDPAPGQERFLKNLENTELFQHFKSAFVTLTGLPLTLHTACAEEGHAACETTQNLAGVVETCVPVKVGRKIIACLETGGVRLAPSPGEHFTPLAQAMLEDNCSAGELRAARAAFDQTPIMDQARYQAAVTLLGAFALQLGESAHRMLFATATNEPEAVRNAKTFIHTHLAEPMTLEAVAKAVHVSPFHFCKLFKRATGLTFTDFVSRARVERAKRLLMKPAARITEVAYDVGFQSLSHFNRSFRRVSRESPTEFRSRMKAGQGAVLAA